MAVITGRRGVITAGAPATATAQNIYKLNDKQALRSLHGATEHAHSIDVVPT